MGNLILMAVLSMVSLAVFFAAVLAFADKKLKVEEDPRIVEAYDCLPHANCGACGYVSCHDFAEHLITSGEDPLKCRVLGEDAKEKLLGYLGHEGGESFSYFPLIRCSAKAANKPSFADYRGIQTCRGASLVFSGGMECEYGCMGLGDCAAACSFQALAIVDGLPVVDLSKCTGCGKCESACPKGIITMAEKRHEKLYYVACSNHDGVLRSRQICGVGCIACGICEKISQEGFFAVKDNLSMEDITKQAKQEEVGMVAAKCPTKVIKALQEGDA
ncbi:MAG: RnfABCDGE type electron transport complex subunit B [Desulfobacula sp.]|nr:RnfABCDGE type electron transport complex subunit B [Desulfobacula sp.]